MDKYTQNEINKTVGQLYYDIGGLTTEEKEKIQIEIEQRIQKIIDDTKEKCIEIVQYNFPIEKNIDRSNKKLQNIIKLIRKAEMD
jgi:hypothetical protein